MPLVSVCIPTYKQVDCLRKCLQSVTDQDFSDYEIIISDDTPDDTVEEVVYNLLKNKPFRYVKNSPSLGSPANWNRAISLATGEYIKIIHHDDWLLTPQSLKQFVDLIENNPQAVMGFSAAEAYSMGSRLKFVHTPSECGINGLKKDCNTLFLGNIIGPPSSIIFRNSPGLCFDENLRWLVDIDFYIRLLQGDNTFAFSKEPLIGVTIESPHQITRECENNKQVELYEYLYLFSKLSHKGKHFFKFLKFLSQLFKRFSISSSRELMLLAPDVVIPWYLKVLSHFTR